MSGLVYEVRRNNDTARVLLYSGRRTVKRAIELLNLSPGEVATLTADADGYYTFRITKP